MVGLTLFEARYLRLWKPAMALSCGISMIAAVVAMRAASGWTGQTAACAVTLAAAAAAPVASLLAYRGSLMQREGPAR